MRLRKSRSSARTRRRKPAVRVKAAEVLRRYRHMLRSANYRVLGRRILQTGVRDPAGSLGAFDGARIIGVNLHKPRTPRLVLSWGKARSPAGPVKIPVLTTQTE